ncbi:hypothetical protein MUP01_02280 [Candidatus Bathyarchaeota archaeon]|nr:hypothetical protein [Candidatus Bathyarchaeota archaeon]
MLTERRIKDGLPCRCGIQLACPCELCKDRNPTLNRWEWVDETVIRCPVCGNAEESSIWGSREAAKAEMMANPKRR